VVVPYSNAYAVDSPPEFTDAYRIAVEYVIAAALPVVAAGADAAEA
jgi:hypothetical protein